MSSGLGGDNRALQDETQHRVEVSSPRASRRAVPPRQQRKTLQVKWEIVGNVPVSLSLPGLTQGWCKRCHQGTGTGLLPQLMGTRTAWERSSLLQVHEKSGAGNQRQHQSSFLHWHLPHCLLCARSADVLPPPTSLGSISWQAFLLCVESRINRSGALAGDWRKTIWKEK